MWCCVVLGHSIRRQKKKKVADWCTGRERLEGSERGALLHHHRRSPATVRVAHVNPNISFWRSSSKEELRNIIESYLDPSFTKRFVRSSVKGVTPGDAGMSVLGIYCTRPSQYFVPCCV